MRKFMATIVLSIILLFSIGVLANASCTDETEAHFSWSSVISKSIFGTLVASPVVVYLSLNNRKEN